jgi:hypothetical protein
VLFLAHKEEKLSLNRITLMIRKICDEYCKTKLYYKSE